MPIEVPLSEVQQQSSNVRGTTDISETEAEISVLDLLIILTERKRFILTITAIFTLVAIVVSLLLPKQYTATSTILTPQQSSSMGSLLVSQLANLGGGGVLGASSLGIKNPNDQFVGMMKSRTVEDAMIQKFGLMQEYGSSLGSDARKKLESKTTIEGSGKDGLIHLSIEDRNPNRASELANGYVEQFRSLSEHLAITEASQRRLFFEQQLEQAKDKLAQAEEAMKQTEQKTGLIQLDSQARALIEAATVLRAQVAAKEVQIKSLQTFATEQNAQLIQAQQELQSLQAQLAKLGGSADTADQGLMVPKGMVPEAGLEYVRKLRDVKYYETIFDILARQFEVAKLDEAKQGAVIQVIDVAVPPDRHSFPKRGLIAGLSAILGLIVGIVISFMQAGYKRLQEDVNFANKLRKLRRGLSLNRSRERV